MRLYEVYFYLLNGESFKLDLEGADNTIASKVKVFLKDNGGGTAEVYANGFYTIVEA